MKDDILGGLKEKFDQYSLWDVAEKFYRDYKLDVCSGIVPEVRFDDHKVPSDDCFKTLLAARNSLKAKEPVKYKDLFDQLAVKKLLQIPYAQVLETAAAICKYTGFSENVVFKWYEDKLEMFYVTKEMVNELVQYISSLFDERVCKAAFKDAILIGVDEAKRRIDGLISYTGKFAQEIMYFLYLKNPGNSYLFYPYYTDPVEAIVHLRKYFDEETTAHILISDQWYLYVYKDKAYHSSSHYNHDHEYIAKLVAAYQLQIQTAIEFRCLRKEIIPDDISEQWIERFIPLFSKIKPMQYEYPYCPNLIRSLVCVVTAYSNCGLCIPDEFARYNDN